MTPNNKMSSVLSGFGIFWILWDSWNHLGRFDNPGPLLNTPWGKVGILGPRSWDFKFFWEPSALGFLGTLGVQCDVLWRPGVLRSDGTSSDSLGPLGGRRGTSGAPAANRYTWGVSWELLKPFCGPHWGPLWRLGSTSPQNQQALHRDFRCFDASAGGGGSPDEFQSC